MWGEDSNNLRLRKPKLFYVSNKSIRQVSLGKRHGIIVTEEEKGGIYGWGDGTYGELGVTDDLPIEQPTQLQFFADKGIKHVATGARHTLVVDREGNIYAMGDNSEDQCAISGRRANAPEKILKAFKASKVFAGESHNIAVSDNYDLYNWGGSVINSSWVQQNTNESKLKFMEDLKKRKINKINLAYSNTLVITGQINEISV